MYNALSELMDYFHFIFFAYYATVILVLCNIFKLFQENKITKKIFIIDMFLHLFLIFTILGGLCFLGALIDITNNLYINWVEQLSVILVLNIILDILYLIIYFKKKD